MRAAHLHEMVVFKQEVCGPEENRQHAKKPKSIRATRFITSVADATTVFPCPPRKSKTLFPTVGIFVGGSGHSRTSQRRPDRTHTRFPSSPSDLLQNSFSKLRARNHFNENLKNHPSSGNHTHIEASINSHYIYSSTQNEDDGHTSVWPVTLIL